MHTLKKSQSGIGHVSIVLLLLVVGVVGLAGWRVTRQTETDSQGQSNQGRVEVQSKEEDLVLQNIGLVNFDSIDITADATRDFTSRGLKGFYVFGDNLSEGRKNPNFEYASLKEETQIISAIDGIVGFVRQQTDSSDYEVFIQPKEKSAWTIGYDHVVDVTLKQGDSVKAGDVLGKPARQNNGLLRFEFQVNKDQDGQTTHYCPTTLLADDVKANILSSLLTMQNQWETTTGFELYNTDMQEPLGCMQKTMSVSEAEGR